jgi:hypothetical protein
MLSALSAPAASSQRSSARRARKPIEIDQKAVLGRQLEAVANEFLGRTGKYRSRKAAVNAIASRERQDALFEVGPEGLKKIAV